MKKMHIINIGYHHFGFSSLTAATNALAAIEKGVYLMRLGFETYETGAEPPVLSLELNKPVTEPPPKPKPLRLPAPKRNTVPCEHCEHVSVIRGTNCRSCGSFVP